MVACEKEEENTIVTPIDSTIQLEAKGVSTTDEIILNFRTVKEYPCINYRISMTKFSAQNSIEINLDAIRGEDKCATAMGPATAEINLGVLAIGEYDLDLNTPHSPNSGILKVTATQIIFKFDRLEGIDILTPAVQR